MRRQMTDGTYRWLGRGWGMPRGIPMGYQGGGSLGRRQPKAIGEQTHTKARLTAGVRV